VCLWGVRGLKPSSSASCKPAQLLCRFMNTATIATELHARRKQSILDAARLAALPGRREQRGSIHRKVPAGVDLSTARARLRGRTGGRACTGVRACACAYPCECVWLHHVLQ
jgi:hypothetical protein